MYTSWSLKGCMLCVFFVASQAIGLAKMIAPSNAITNFTVTRRLYPEHDFRGWRDQCHATIPRLLISRSRSNERRRRNGKFSSSSRSRRALSATGMCRFLAHGPVRGREPNYPLKVNASSRPRAVSHSEIVGHLSVGAASTESEFATDSGNADRMFALGRSLHLRRHRSPASRRLALKLFHESMRLRPEWKQTDSRFAMDSGIDNALAAFACEDDVLHSDGGNIVRERVKIETPVQGDKGDAILPEAVESLRETLATLGYTARRVQERFWPAVGPYHGQRLPGPYFLRKSYDHTHAATVASLGPLRDGLDAVIRLFLLGLAIPLEDVRRSLGPRGVESARRLGILGNCPVDPSLAMSLVQLFPLDAGALSSVPPKTPDDGNRAGGGDCDSSTRATALPAQYYSASSAKSTKLEAAERAVVSDSLAVLGRVGDGGGGHGEGIDSPTDMVFATDWPPPGSTALTEEPVMYIGPDSIGLVQHAPRCVASCPPTKYVADGELGDAGGRTDGGERGAMQPNKTESILDLCCGSGVQGVAAALLRGGNARVTCVDINPRAVRFARFNAALNGLDGGRFRAAVGDLYNTTARGPREDGVYPTCPPPLATAIRNSTPPATISRGLSSAFVRGADASEYDGIAGSRSSSFGKARERGGEGHILSLNKTEGGDDVGVGQGLPLPSSADDASSWSSFDLILANPPFVPVPPKLGRAKQRYDAFASGGAGGEEIVSGVFRGVMERLNPGGVLAVVTELANPRDFGAKLGRWIGAPPAFAAAAVGGAASLERGEHPQGQTNTSSSNAGANEFRVSASGALERTVPGAATHGWDAVVFHEDRPWTAAEYSAKRAGGDGEVRDWEKHLERVEIEEMAPGFVFVRRRCLGYREAEHHPAETCMHGSCWRIEGVEKLWAPYNRAALASTELALRRLQNL